MTEVARLLDELAVKDLSHRYAIALDRGDREEWASLFSDDVAFESGT